MAVAQQQGINLMFYSIPVDYMISDRTKGWKRFTKNYANFLIDRLGC
jgi:hypothetical protein